MMKKTIAMLSCGALLASMLVGCGNGNNANVPSSSESEDGQLAKRPFMSASLLLWSALSMRLFHCITKASPM